MYRHRGKFVMLREIFTLRYVLSGRVSSTTECTKCKQAFAARAAQVVSPTGALKVYVFRGSSIFEAALNTHHLPGLLNIQVHDCQRTEQSLIS
ncbi:hypothetical protein SRHO_G00223650 [Serrasalmus rhombeus]